MDRRVNHESLSDVADARRGEQTAQRKAPVIIDVPHHNLKQQFEFARRDSGSLWLGIGFHAGWDWAQSFLYGTPDSGTMMQGHLLVTHMFGNARLTGGTAGLEGSGLSAPVLVTGAAALAFAMHRLGLFLAPPRGERG